MYAYKHTQIGYLVLTITVVLLLSYIGIYGIISTGDGLNNIVIVIMIFVLFILISFSTLQVIIDETFIRIKFGYGIFHKKFSLDDIISVNMVKNRWYYGWGIRSWLWPRMWIYNVSGFDAVEIVMSNGNIYRIGTDEPAKLSAAITYVVAKRQ